MPKESKKKGDSVGLFLGNLIWIFIVLIIMNSVCIVGPWRKEYKKLEEFEVNGKMVKIATEKEIQAEANRHPCEAGLIKTYGIRENCYYTSEADCTWPGNSGFVGDEAIYIMLCIAVSLSAVNLIIPCVSLCVYKISIILPITCVIHFSLLLASVIVCGVNYNTIYFSSNLVNLESNPTYAALYRVEGDMIIGPHPHIIEFGSEFYAACVAAGISLLATCIAGCFTVTVVKEKKNYLTKNDA